MNKKKFYWFLNFFFLSIAIYSQNTLLDINYDPPKSIKSISEDEILFQKIYLQYESAINNLEERIVKEKALNTIEAVNNAIEKTKKDILEKEKQKDHAQKLAMESMLQKQFESEYAKKLENAVQKKENALQKQFESEYAKKLKSKIKEIENEARNHYTIMLEQETKKLTTQIRKEDQFLLAKFKAILEHWNTPAIIFISLLGFFFIIIISKTTQKKFERKYPKAYCEKRIADLNRQFSEIENEITTKWTTCLSNINDPETMSYFILYSNQSEKEFIMVKEQLDTIPWKYTKSKIKYFIERLEKIKNTFIAMDTSDEKVQKQINNIVKSFNKTIEIYRRRK